MKPNFALSLSFEGIRLLHRAAGGWRVVGEVELDAEDMGGELAVLRRTASSLEPGGVRSKLLVPNDQIKYLTIVTPDMDHAARLAAAEAALDGATPYAVTDLVFDISVEGDKTHIAAVARETLTEAEAFATEHRFHPVSLAAVPANQPYLGEPFFGQTTSAAALLEHGETVEPDGIAVVVIGDVLPEAATQPEPAPDKDPVPEPETTVEQHARTAPDKSAPPEATARASALASSPAEVRPAKPEEPPAGLAEERPEPPAAAPVASRDAESKRPATQDLQSTETPKPVASPEPAKAAKDQPKAEAPAKPPAADPAPVPPAAPVQPPRLGAASRDAGPAPRPVVTAPPAPGQIRAADASPSASGFASRRGAKAATVGRREPALATQKKSVTTSETPLPNTSVTAPSVPVPEDQDIKPDSSSFAPGKPDSTSRAKAGFLSRRKVKAASVAKAAPNPALQVDPPDTEAERMTVFGARRTEIGGKPRFLGLILTAALLVFLAGVAAWAAVFLDDGFKLSRWFGDEEPPAATTSPATPIEAPEELQTVSLDPGLTEEDSAVIDALSEPVQPVPPAEPTEAEAEAKYAATGIWPRAPQQPPAPAAPIDIDDFYLTSIDPVSTSNDAVALPKVTGFGTDQEVASVSSPAAAGTRFAYDEKGLLIPTPQGALSPDGYTVYLGRPAVLPPANLQRTEVAPAEAGGAEEALAAFRPRKRPDDLVETTERAQLGGLTRAELGGFRPNLRPVSVQQLAEAEAAKAAASGGATVDTSDAVAAALAAVPAPAPAFENATRFAVKASVRPDPRPGNFARIVNRARRAAAEQQETRVASAATVAPRVVTPKIPSKTSVARQATVKNAINLRNVNLIGVYGKPSNRRALVRLGNGRYKKVVVGDRIDGGRVSAIGDSELRYTKGGRNVVLKMPRG